MLMYLEATDPDYLDRIYDGPYVPKRLVARTEELPEHYVQKIKTEWTTEEKTQVLKDAKVKNILHNSLDVVMSNRVIACTTAKEIWETLETQCQGTESIKRNRRAILVQEYEQFDAKSDESLTDLYDRFLTLLNNLSLVGKEYAAEDSNTKFLRALPEDWDTQTSIIRHQYDLNAVSLDEIYGMLRTHDLEVQQRKNRRSIKAKSVALNVEAKSKRKAVEVSRKKVKVVESDTEDAPSDTDPDPESDGDSTDSDMKEMVAMIVKGFKKMKFRKARRQGNLQRRTSNAEKEGYQKQDSKGSKFDKSKVRCYNCNGLGHFATECKKAKTKALITSSKSWMDSSESETEEENFALMATTEEIADPEEKVLSTVFDFDTNNVSELRSFLKSLHISFRSQSLENARILSEMSEVRKRNDHLEAELLFMQEVQRECDNARHIKLETEFKCTALEKELADVKEKLRTWTHSGTKTHSIITDKNWKTCLGYKSENELNKGKVVVDESTNPKTYTHVIDKTKSDIKPVKYVYPRDPKSTAEKGSTSKQDSESKTVKVTKGKNVGLLSQKQLRDKISEVTGIQRAKTAKRNRNGKVGITKENNYRYIPNAPRKVCFNCGNSNHLAIDCRKSKKKATVVPKSDIRNRSVFYKPQNPCFHCGSKWHSIYTCEEYHNLYYNYYEPLPKFNKSANSGKFLNVKQKNACNNTDSDKTDPECNVFVKKSSVVKNVKLHANRTQQVWVLKNPN